MVVEGDVNIAGGQAIVGNVSHTGPKDESANDITK